MKSENEIEEDREWIREFIVLMSSWELGEGITESVAEATPTPLHRKYLILESFELIRRMYISDLCFYSKTQLLSS